VVDRVARAAVDHLVERLVVEGVRQRLAHADVVDRRRSRVDVDRVDAARRDRRVHAVLGLGERVGPDRLCGLDLAVGNAGLAHLVVEHHAET